MRALVTGAAGQVGMEVVKALSTGGRRDTVVAVSRRELDVGDRIAVHEMVHGVRPDAVVNCAARTAVDVCESDAAGTFRVNAAGVGHLADACRSTGAHLTTISTDYVFDGAKNEPYTERDPTNPLSVYGRSKLAGERAASASSAGGSGSGFEFDNGSECGGGSESGGSGVTVVRTSLVCGAHGSNAVKTVLAQLRRQTELHYVTDQVSCPTFAADLAEVLLRLTRRRLVGLFHVTNQGEASRFDLARAVAAAAGADPGRVSPISTADLPRPGPAAPRPAYSVLDNAALQDAGEPLLRHFTEPLAELVEPLR